MELKKGSDPFPPPSSTIDLPAFQAMLRNTPNLHSGVGSITWRINGERAMVLGWGRAILMQIAHPMVAQGVAEHSTFANSFSAKVGRFWRTLDRMLRLTFGTPEEVWKAARGIDHIHGRVYGERADTLYSARDIELLKWVHTTFVDSMLKTYSLLVRPLTEEEQNDYVFKASIIGPLMGAPQGFFPESLAELNDYLNSVIESGTLHIDAQTMRLAHYVLDGVPIPFVKHGLSWMLRLSTAALLPTRLREAYGLRLSRYEAALFKGAAWCSRVLHRVIPTPLRRWRRALS